MRHRRIPSDILTTMLLAALAVVALTFAACEKDRASKAAECQTRTSPVACQQCCEGQAGTYEWVFAGAEGDYPCECIPVP